MLDKIDYRSSMFQYFSVEPWIPADHPLHPVKQLTESVLSAISAGLEIRPSIPPEYLLKPQFLQSGGLDQFNFSRLRKRLARKDKPPDSCQDAGCRQAIT